MTRAFLIAVRLHDGCYHGSGDWPPSPARLFQALVAGAARGGTLPEGDRAALAWLESLPPPRIGAPPSRLGQGFKAFVPNNDLDAVGGDPARIGEIRAPKPVRPRHFDGDAPLAYLWTFEPDAAAESHARALTGIAERLYQLGRGIDMAWARGEVLDAAEAGARLAADGHSIRNPGRGGAGATLACPKPGSLASLETRFSAARRRFSMTGAGRRARQLFTQAPKPDFAQVPYDSPHSLLLFEIRHAAEDGAFAPQAPRGTAALTERLRDHAAARLRRGLGDAGLVERVVVGRGSVEADKAQRIRILPLPSIGHRHVTGSIRRVLVDVPSDCPIVARDVAWAFSGLPLDIDAETGEIATAGAVLVAAEDRSMLSRYGVEAGPPARVWRTVTPAALSQGAARRRIDPRRVREEAKGGAERLGEEAGAADAARQAVRHAGIGVEVASVRVQREPFAARGERAEAFAPGTRFAKERLWHVEMVFARPVAGPVAIGDGRYLGLGLMAPHGALEGVLAFRVTDGLVAAAGTEAVTRALRRAVMARVQEVLGERTAMPTFFSGHAPDGSVARSGRHEHLAFVHDTASGHLLVVAPHLLERRSASLEERRHLNALARALDGFRELRAGAAGRLFLAPAQAGPAGLPVLAASRVWESLTPYRVTRHVRAGDAARALAADLDAACRRDRLPAPRIDVLATGAEPGRGLSGRARLVFRTAVAGPIVLGRDRHLGGGLFGPAHDD